MKQKAFNRHNSRFKEKICNLSPRFYCSFRMEYGVCSLDIQSAYPKCEYQYEPKEKL